MLWLFSQVSISGDSASDPIGFFSVMTIICVVLIIVCGLAFLPFIIIGGVTRRQAEKLYNQRLNTIIAQYEAPHQLSPAEVGLLYDMHAGTKEMIATLFHLEQRGIITVKNDSTVEIVDTARFESLQEYEKIAIRAHKGDTSQLEAARQPQTFTYTTDEGETRQFIFMTAPKQTTAAFRAAVRTSTAAKGYPTKNFAVSFNLRAWFIAIILGHVLIFPLASIGVGDDGAWSFAAFSFAYTLSFGIGVFIWPAYVGAGYLIMFLWTKVAGRYWINTKKARAIWPELEGYRLYLKKVELDNVQFESETGSHVSATDALSYAIVFNLDTKWEKLLANRTQTP